MDLPISFSLALNLALLPTPDLLQSASAATQPMENFSPSGSGALMVIRAGGWVGKNSAKNLLTSGKSASSGTMTVVFTTRSSEEPPARRTVSRLWNAWRNCCSVSSGALPVAGSTPGWPATKSRPPARTAWE